MSVINLNHSAKTGRGGEQSLKRSSPSPNVCLDIPGGGRDLSPK